MDLRLRQVDGFFEVGRALERLKAFTDVLGAAGVTQLEYQAMLVIKTRPGEKITVRDLAHQLRLTRAFSARLADRLVENHFALRRRSRRPPETIVQLSESGGEILAQLATRHLEALRAAEEIMEGASSPPCEA
ncbi:MAG: MarR family transcriptional regulator [Caulobacteraceae bacterium]|nr:MarR family transcriptional regulator [Caulobacteraceae bacterium]